MELTDADMEVFVGWVARVVTPSARVKPSTQDTHLAARAESAAVAARVIFDAAARPADEDLEQVLFDLLCCEREDLRAASRFRPRASTRRRRGTASGHGQ
jgi:hypothetical protein